MGALASVVAPLREMPRAGTLALLLLVTLGYFVGPAGWNQNSRLALTRALVEQQTTIIDDYHHTTGDKSFRDGHFYSDKAPGMSLLATIPYAGFYAVRRLSGRPLPDVEVVPLDPVDRAAGRTPPPDQLLPGDRLVYDDAHRVALYLCRLLTTTLLSLLGLAAFYLLALRQLGAHRDAMWTSLAYLFATPVLAYSTAFYGHQPCGALLLVAFALVVLVPDGFRARGGDRIVPWLVGASLGLAVACEYPAAVPAALITAWATWRRGLVFGTHVVVGGLPFAVVLALYHQVAFGHPLSTGYDHVYLPEFAEGMAVNYGIGAPDPGVLLELLFGRYRGLFYASPLLLLAVWGLFVHADKSRGPSRQGSGLFSVDLSLGIVIIAYYLLLNSGYYMWDGGAAFGPRHAIPMLGFLALGLTPVVQLLPRAFAVLASVSAVHAIAAAAVSPELPQFGDPIWGHAVPVLLVGDSHATNVGELLGLPGVFSLAPLALAWLWLWPGREARRPAA